MLSYQDWAELSTAYPGARTITLRLTLSNGTTETVVTNLRIEDFRRYYRGFNAKLVDGTPVTITAIEEEII